jgi:hypothetical protein
MRQREDQAQNAAIYGPAAAHAEHQPGQQITFIDPESGEEGAGILLYVRAPGTTHKGGPSHPTVYMVDDGRGFPRALYASDIRQRR